MIPLTFTIIYGEGEQLGMLGRFDSAMDQRACKWVLHRANIWKGMVDVFGSGRVQKQRTMAIESFGPGSDLGNSDMKTLNTNIGKSTEQL